eukprot:gene24564-biopygen11911
MGKKQPTSSWAHLVWDQATYVGSLNVDSLIGDVVNGCIAGLLRVLVAPAAPQFRLFYLLVAPAAPQIFIPPQSPEPSAQVPASECAACTGNDSVLSFVIRMHPWHAGGTPSDRCDRGRFGSCWVGSLRPSITLGPAQADVDAVPSQFSGLQQSRPCRAVAVFRSTVS